MKKVIINAKVDPVLKKEAQEVARELGIPLSTVISAALREFVMNKSVTVRAQNDQSHAPFFDKTDIETATALAAKKGRLTTAMLQRKFRISYPRANAMLAMLRELRVIDENNKALD